MQLCHLVNSIWNIHLLSSRRYLGYLWHNQRTCFLIFEIHIVWVAMQKAIDLYHFHWFSLCGWKTTGVFPYKTPLLTTSSISGTTSGQNLRGSHFGSKFIVNIKIHFGFGIFHFGSAYERKLKRGRSLEKSRKDISD